MPVWHGVRAHSFLLVFVAALVVRLINLALLQGDHAFFAEPDTASYWATGAALATPRSFWPTLSSMTERMPLYPLFLAGFRSVLGDAPRAVAMVQAGIDAGTCTLIAALGALVSPLTGRIAGELWLPFPQRLSSSAARSLPTRCSCSSSRSCCSPARAFCCAPRSRWPSLQVSPADWRLSRGPELRSSSLRRCR